MVVEFNESEVVLSTESETAWVKPAPVAQVIEQKSVVKSIVDLKAYCIGARVKLESMDIKDGKLKSGAMELVSKFGHKTKKELIGEYANMIGEIKAKHENPGLSGFMIDQADGNAMKGNSLINTKNGFVTFNSQAFGLQRTPVYFNKLKVSHADFNAIRESLHSSKGGKAIKAWIASGRSDIYQRSYSKIKAKYMAMSQAENLRAQAAAEVGERASFKDGLEKSIHSTVILQPMPMAGTLGAEKVLQIENFKMPTNMEIQKEAQEETFKFLQNLALKPQSTSAVIESIESIVQGVAIKMATSSRMFSDSNQLPKVKIVGTTGTITGPIDALPLQGDHLVQHFVASNKKSIGIVTHVILTSDEGVKTNPWLCTKFQVQVGAGNPWVDFAPEGKSSQLGIEGKTNDGSLVVHPSRTATQNKWFKSDGFWLDSSDGKHGPYYRLVHQKEYLMLPITQAMVYKKKYSNKVPMCPNLNTGDNGCFDGTLKDLEERCNNHPKCQGFSFTHLNDKETKGRGCLKYRCEQVADDGNEFQEKNKMDYWTKQAFVYKTTPADDLCTTTCGFGGDTQHGDVFCTQIFDGKEVSGDMCDYWHPKLLRPKVPEKKCPPTKPCTRWKATNVAPCTRCCKHRNGCSAYTKSAEPKCIQTNTNGDVPDSDCTYWGLQKPAARTVQCPAIKWVAKCV